MKRSDLYKQRLLESEHDLEALRNLREYRRAISAESFVETILPELKNRFSVTEFARNSFRITDGKTTIDYYPTSRRVFLHGSKRWATINAPDKILFWITKQFKPQ